MDGGYIGCNPYIERHLAIFVDPFHGGEILFKQDCQERLSQVYQQPVKLEEHFLNIATSVTQGGSR